MSWLKLSLACTLLTVPALLAEPAKTDPDASTPKGTPSAQKAGTPAPAKSPASSDEERQKAILVGIPTGATYHGVSIPNMDPSGKLLSLFQAKSAKRTGDRNFEMEDLKIEIHNSDGSTFHVEMAHSVFNLDTNVLTSNTPTTIKRDDFVINGDRAEFHTKEKFGRLFGNVKMIINSGDTDNSSDTTKSGKPKKSDHPKKPVDTSKPGDTTNSGTINK